jgi:hypothetical protein
VRQFRREKARECAFAAASVLYGALTSDTQRCNAVNERGSGTRDVASWLGIELPKDLARPQERRREWENLHGPDESEIIYEFADGWTVRNIVRFKEAVREGYLMKHCLTGRETHWGTTSENFLVERLCHDGCYLASLRDPRNFPRMTFFLVLSHGVSVAIEPHSVGFGPGLDPRYAGRIDEFEQAQIPPLTEPQEIFNTAMSSPNCSYRTNLESLDMCPIAPALWIR